MRTRAILGAATACGAAAFLWTLASAKPPQRVRRGGPAGMHMAVAPAPDDLAGLEAFVAQVPTDAEAWFNLAEQRRNAGDFGGEREAWRHVQRLADEQATRQRDDPRAWFMLAWASDKIADDGGAAAWERARALYESRADGPRAGNWRLWHRLGWCRARTGQPEGAREAWGRAAELLGGRVSGSLEREQTRQLVRDLALSGRTGEAMTLLEQTISFWDPGALANDECLDPLRGTERFRAAARRAMFGQAIDPG
jgi:hypothetical protein